MRMNTQLLCSHNVDSKSLLLAIINSNVGLNFYFVYDYMTIWNKKKSILFYVLSNIAIFYLLANNQNQYATSLNIISQVLWLKLSYFSEFATSYLTLLDEDFFEKLDEKAAAIKVLLSLFVAANKGVPAEADPEILKREGALCRPPWLADEENFRFHVF